jgi:hypothetical protein
MVLDLMHDKVKPPSLKEQLGAFLAVESWNSSDDGFDPLLVHLRFLAFVDFVRASSAEDDRLAQSDVLSEFGSVEVLPAGNGKKDKWFMFDVGESSKLLDVIGELSKYDLNTLIVFVKARCEVLEGCRVLDKRKLRTSVLVREVVLKERALAPFMEEYEASAYNRVLIPALERYRDSKFPQEA